MNLAGPLRSALVAFDPIATLLAQYKGEPGVFTKRPIPGDATYPLVLVSPDISITDEDALRTSRPIVLRDLTVFGEQPDQYRVVEQIGYLMRGLFHRQRFAISVPSFHVVEIVAMGPRIAPSDDDDHLARVVPLRIRLEALA